MRRVAGWWQRRIPDGPLALACVGVILILLFLAHAADRGFEESTRLREAVSESYEARTALQTVLTLHQDIEAGQRGYIITGDPQFLAPYRRAEAQIEANLARFERRASHEEELLLIKALRVASAQKRQFASETVQLVDDGRRDEAIPMVSDGGGKRAMDRIRALVDAISEGERQTLERRIKVAEIYRNKLRVRALGLQIGLIMLLTIAGLVIARSRASREKAHLHARDMAARQEAIFESAKDGMIVLNPSGSIESLNPAAASMFGVSSQDLLRRDIGILFEVAPDRGQIETFLRRLMANQKTSYGQIQEFIGRRKDGPTFPLEVSVSSVYLADKTLFLAVMRDISDRREIEQMKSEFVATVSHELRTPLTSIAGSLGLISGGAAGEVSTKVGRLVEIAHSNAARLIRLTNDILDIEKIEAGRMRFDIQSLPLGPLIEAAIQQSAGFANEYGVTMRVEPVDPAAIVLADQDRLMQVITNLLSNAIKFSPRGEVVTVTVKALDRRYRISVADRGAGIPEAFRDRIFGKFAQADTSDARQKGGTGLGLSIVREITVRLGGSVSFESVSGEGTVFHIDLPAGGPSGPTAMPEVLVDLQSANPSLPVVLHVEDDPDMLSLVVSAFHGKAIVQSMSSVAEARAAMRSVDYAAAILDMGVSDGSGIDLVEPLRRQSPSRPIVVFTAQDVEYVAGDGVDLMLVKSRASLDMLVSEVMGRIGAQREAPEHAND